MQADVAPFAKCSAAEKVRYLCWTHSPTIARLPISPIRRERVSGGRVCMGGRVEIEYDTRVLSMIVDIENDI